MDIATEKSRFTLLSSSPKETQLKIKFSIFVT